ncbi:MAG: mechanosensitive ion channel family protein [Rickettsiales bacterium]|nr:mechanosensitive ion channel family protein [Rickettsiales bacterium]
MFSLASFKNFIESFGSEYFSALAIFFTYFILACICKFLIFKCEKKFIKSDKFLWYDFFKSLNNPIFFFFLFRGIFSAAEKVSFFDALFKNSVVILNKSLLVITIFWFFISYIVTYEKTLKKNKQQTIAGFNKKAIGILVKIVKFLVFFITAMFIMDILGIDIRGILTFTGIGGAAIGFASKDFIANFFGSVIVFLDKPFSIGDWVKLSNGKEGKVEHIGWRTTKIRTHQTSCIYISNSFFSNMVVENYSRITHRNINKTIELKSVDVKKITNILEKIRESLVKHSSIDSNKEIDCFISEFKESSVKCKINAFTTATKKFEFLQLEQQIMFELAKIINKHKLQMTISN